MQTGSARVLNYIVVPRLAILHEIGDGDAV